MRTFSLFSTSPYALALLGVGLWQSGVKAQPANRDSLPLVKAPVVQDVAPLGAKGVTAPNAVGDGLIGIREVAPVTVDASAYKVAAAIKKLRAGEMTAQQAWDSGALDVDDLIFFLEKGLDSWGGFFYEKDPELRRALVALLVEHGGAKLEKPEELAPTVRLWLADYYGNIQDERVLKLAESVLAEMPRPLPKADDVIGGMPLAFQALERIAWYYDAIGQNSKCAQAWLRMSDYCPQKGWWLGDMWLMSARALDKDGRRDEAQKLRANVRGVHNGWLTALAAYEESQPFITAGKFDEAKAILSRPINATEQVADGKIAQNAWLASLSYRQGNLNEAMRYGQATVQAGEGIKLDNSGVKNLYILGCEVYNRAGGWKTEPIQSDVKKVIIKPNLLQLDQPLYARFQIKTYGDTSVIATVDNPIVQVKILPFNNWGREDLNKKEEQMEVIININDEYMKDHANLNAVLTLKRLDDASSTCKITIAINTDGKENTN